MSLSYRVTEGLAHCVRRRDAVHACPEQTAWAALVSHPPRLLGLVAHVLFSANGSLQGSPSFVVQVTQDRQFTLFASPSPRRPVHRPCCRPSPFTILSSSAECRPLALWPLGPFPQNFDECYLALGISGSFGEVERLSASLSLGPLSSSVCLAHNDGIWRQSDCCTPSLTPPQEIFSWRRPLFTGDPRGKAAKPSPHQVR